MGQHWPSVPDSWLLISHLTVALTPSSFSWSHNKPMFSFPFHLLLLLTSLFESAWTTGMEIKDPHQGPHRDLQREMRAEGRVREARETWEDSRRSWEAGHPSALTPSSISDWSELLLS